MTGRGSYTAIVRGQTTLSAARERFTGRDGRTRMTREEARAGRPALQPFSTALDAKVAKARTELVEWVVSVGGEVNARDVSNRFGVPKDTARMLLLETPGLRRVSTHRNRWTTAPVGAADRPRQQIRKSTVAYALSKGDVFGDTGRTRRPTIDPRRPMPPEFLGLREGDRVRHTHYGPGAVHLILGVWDDRMFVIKFDRLPFQISLWAYVAAWDLVPEALT